MSDNSDASRSYEDICADHGGTKKNGEPCTLAAGWGTPNDSGRCRYCLGVSADGGESHKDNGHAETHGLTADAEKWFKRHKEEAEDDVKRMVSAWMEDAPFGYGNEGNVRLLIHAAINECQMRQGNEYIDDEGIIEESFEGVSEDGRDIIEKKENPVFLQKDRLQRTTIRMLKELGILDDPDTKKAEATGDAAASLAEKLSED